MGIKNYTTTIDPEKTAGEIMRMLGKAGAQRISTTYDPTGNLDGLTFTMRTEYGPREFELPIRTAGVLTAMHRDRAIPASRCTPEQATRTAWRIARDWLDAQIALIEAGLASLDEVMTPWMLANDGSTMYQVMRESGMRAIAAESEGTA